MARPGKFSTRSPQSGTKAELQARRRRHSILAATIAVIARQGLSATTIERVARKAKVAAGTVIFYFGSKERLLLEALQDIAEEFDTARRKAIASAAGDPAAALEAIIAMSFDARVSAPDKVAVWYAFWGEASARSVYLDLVGSHDQDYEEEIGELFSRLIAEGGYDGLDAEWITAGFVGILENQWQSILMDGRRFDRRRATRLARAYLTGIFQRHFR